MKVTCHKSGINFTVPQFSCTADVRQCPQVQHPIFWLSQPALFMQLKEFVRGNLNEEETVLLFLALADSSGKVQWRNPFALTPEAPALMAQQMTQLAGTVSRIQEIRHPHFQVPVYVCSTHAGQNTVRGFMRMLATWDETIADFASAAADKEAAARLLRLEDGLERLVRLAKQKPLSYAKAISKWAALAGEFPAGNTLLNDGSTMPLSEYWQGIIIKCILRENVHRIPKDDLVELIEHCEEMIPHGTIHAAALMESLRNGVRQQMEFLGAPALSGVKLFSIVPMTSEDKIAVEREKAVMTAMAAAAPLTMPTKEQYATAFLYLSAMAKWRAAQQLKEAQELARAEVAQKEAAEETTQITDADDGTLGTDAEGVL